MKNTTWAIVGAGMAGLACARVLADAGQKVVLFDKGRSPGGRMATRRVATPEGELSFDHGAQFFTIRDEGFADAVARFNVAHAPWPSTLKTVSAASTAIAPVSDRFVAMPGMSAMGRAFADGLEVRLGVQITSLSRSREGWALHTADADLTQCFDGVVIATPPAQARPLVEPHDVALGMQASAAVVTPCWAGLFAFDPPIDIGADAVTLPDHPQIAWMGVNSTKPGRTGAMQCLVAHATPAWSQAYLEAPAADVANALLEAVRSLFDIASMPRHASAHRWRYAKAGPSATTPFFWNAALGLGVCGDWCVDGRVEAAWQSGTRLGRTLIA